MKEIFIGSSTEALGQARKVAALLEGEGVRPRLWSDAFGLGQITLEVIETIAREVAGAVFLATPDDDSVIREKKVKVPRANVLFEFGYLMSTLTRTQVALCQYEGVELPSDFKGLTVLRMGPFRPTEELSYTVGEGLRNWASRLPMNPEQNEGVDWSQVSKVLEGELDWYPPTATTSTPLAPDEIEQALAHLSGWSRTERPGGVGQEGKRVEITRTYRFYTFEDAIHFMNTASRYFSQVRHQPDWRNVWSSVRIWLTSWDIGHRLSQKDIALAEKLDHLYESYRPT
jgi:pterin-4a-carbinolamine dehydratase